MGPSGSGKTTLLHLLSRLYEPTFGEILIDDIPLNKIQQLTLRRAVGIVPQEAQIFSGSMRDNICYGRPDATNEQIMDAAKAAQMHDFILEMKVQYETLIGQKGTSLSGGQRQRLSLARALLTNPELLILDDCTSALDANTEQKIQETLAKILVGKTAIMVSMRVSMAMRCHKICVIEDGRVTEFGSHEELLKHNGFYARLYHQQTE
jgi:subfamily B ATP-binding cassette protein MsbA